jgi:hypothetical protein
MRETKRGRRHRRWPIALVGAGALLIALSAAWEQVAVPALVRFPTDVDQRVEFAGTAQLFLDPATMAPYEQPLLLPFHATRHIVAVGSESDRETVVLREENTVAVGELPESRQVHQYVMDRTSLANLADPRAWAYLTTNVVDRAGAFWLSFPMHAGDATSYPMFKDEIGRTITSVSDPAVARAAGRPRGLELIGFSVEPDAAPITPAYQETLGETVPLPQQVTLAQLDPILDANGVDVEKTVAALLPVVTPTELATLTELAAQPITLVYSTAFSGSTAVEPRTGAIVDVTAIDETIEASPDPAALPPLLAILQQHEDVPEVAAALAGLQQLSEHPITLLRYRYAQTPASVLDVAGTVKGKLADIRMAETTIPWTAAIVGGALLALGATLLAVRRRPRGQGPSSGAASTERTQDAPAPVEIERPERTPVPV